MILAAHEFIIAELDGKLFAASQQMELPTAGYVCNIHGDYRGPNIGSDLVQPIFSGPMRHLAWDDACLIR